MINFDVSKKLLEKINIYADKDIFSVMLNYVLNKCTKLYEKSFENTMRNSLYNIHKKYKDIDRKNELLANKNFMKHRNKELAETDLNTIKFIEYLYKDVFQYMNISIFLKMNLIFFRDRSVTFNNYKLMTNFFDFIFIKFNVNNYMDYLYQYNYIEPLITKFGGDALKQDIDKLFNGMGLNSLFCDRLDNSYMVRCTDEISSHIMFPMPKLKEVDRNDLGDCLMYNKKLCNQFKASNADEQQIIAADYMLQRKLTR